MKQWQIEQMKKEQAIKGETNDIAMEQTEVKPAEPVVKKRRDRVPVGVPRLKLAFRNQQPGFRYRWVSDVGNRLSDFEDGGYEYVNKKQANEGDSGTDIGSKISKVVMTNEDGSPRRAYLMCIKREWYEEDQAEKQRKIDEVERQILEGRDTTGSPGRDGRYIPSSGGTRIERY